MIPETKLCNFDTRNPDGVISYLTNEEIDEECLTTKSKDGCSCDNCFYGRTELAELLIISKVENKYIPNDAHSFEVFAIKDSEDSLTGKQAFIGFKLKNGDFHFIGVPYTEQTKK